MNMFRRGLGLAGLVGGLTVMARLIRMLPCFSLVRCVRLLLMGTLDTGKSPGTCEGDIACVPPEPPPPADLPLPETDTPDSATIPDTEAIQGLWQFLQQETYRQRGGGYRQDWAFHQVAANRNLGAPLALSAGSADYVIADGRSYGFQPFARDTLFNEIPRWAEVQSLVDQLTAVIPTTGLLYQLLAAGFRRSGGTLHPTQAFAQFVVRERLGPALTEGFRITVDGVQYAVQVFALDTLYSPVGQWSDVRRLSTTPEGSLRTACLEATYEHVTDSAYDPRASFHAAGLREGLGTPLTGVYRTNFAGNTFDVQVFARDTLYARPGNPALRQSALPRPQFDLTTTRTTTPELSTPEDAVTRRQAIFSMLPLAGQPPISQFYGYTRFAAGAGRGFYTATQGRHSGIDFAVELGTPLLAIDHGLVVWAGANVDGVSFGAGPRSIIVRYGSVYALYGHVSSEEVQKGQRVVPGQIIGRSGFPSAPHLHFEIRPVPDSAADNRDSDQDPVNPGYALNPVELFSPDLMRYFDRQLARLGGNAHFCRGTFGDQEQIRFGGPVDRRSCG